MDNAELNRSLRDAIHEATGEIRRDIGRLEGLLESHRRDPYAHREMVAQEQAPARETLRNWDEWRSTVNIRMAALAGGLGVFVFLVGTFGVFVATRIIK